MISKYKLKFNEAEKTYYVISCEKIVCPVCGCDQLKSKGRRERKVISLDKNTKFKIRRLKCEKCKKIHHELPDNIVPYKRHSAEIIEKIINGDEKGLSCENSTIVRIRKWWEGNKLYIKSALE
jgi:hypothetical protein